MWVIYEHNDPINLNNVAGIGKDIDTYGNNTPSVGFIGITGKLITTWYFENSENRDKCYEELLSKIGLVKINS